MTSVSEGSLQTLQGISQLPGTVQSDLKHIEDDVTCSSSAMPISEADGFPKSGQPMEALRESIRHAVGRPLSAKKRKDPLSLIEKPIFSRYPSNGAYSPSDGSWTPRSDLSDSDSASYLNFKFETEDGQQSETRLERLNGLNRQWNDLQYQQKSYGNELTEGVQSHLDELEKCLDTNSNSLANIDDMLPLEVQLEQVASSQDNLWALMPKLDEISEVAEMLIDSALETPNEDAEEGDARRSVSGLQSQVVDISGRFSAVLDECDKRKNDILRRIEDEASVGKSWWSKKQTKNDLDQLSSWFRESYDLIVAEVYVTFDKSILKEILQQAQEIEEGSRNREELVSEMLQQSESKHATPKSKDVFSLEELQDKFAGLTQLAKKKVEDLGLLLKLSMKREQEIESLQTQVANLQKWVKSRHTPPDLLVPAVIGVADSLSSQSTQDMQQAIQYEVAALESFMAEVHEEGLRFLKNTKPYNVKSDNLGDGLTSSNDEDGSDSEQSSIIADPAAQFLNQWNYLKDRLEKRKAKINRQLLHHSKQDPSGAVSTAFRVFHLEEESQDRLTSLETRLLNVPQCYEADLSTKALLLQFQTLNSCWKTVILQVKEKDQRLTDILELQSKYLNSLNDAVLWLDSLELKIFSASLVKTWEEQLIEHEVLYREMKAFESEFRLLNDTCNEVLGDAMSSPRREKVTHLSNELQDRIKVLETAIKRKDEQVQLNTLNRQNQRNELSCLFQKLEELREQVLDSLRTHDLNIEERKRRCSNHQAEHKILVTELENLMESFEGVGLASKTDSLTLAQSNILEKLLDDVKFFIDQFASKVVNDEDMKGQLIKLISDYDSFLASAETHLMNEHEEISAASPGELETHLKDFKSFFEDLDGHWHMLNGFYEQMEPSTKLRFAEKIACLNLRTIKVKDQASDLGKKFEVTLLHWASVDESMRRVETWLINSERLPILSSYDSSLLHVHSYQEACELKQQLTDLQGELYVQESNAHRVLQDAKMFVRASMMCPSVSGKTQVLERMWKELLAKVNKKHERVFILVETWAGFEKGIKEIFSWLERVMEKLERMKNERYSQMNPAELYLKLQSLMELGRDLIWNKMSVDRVRSIAGTVQQICGNHFMPKEIDGKIVKLLSEWNYVNRELDVLKHNVQKYRQDAMSLQQHLVELSVWIDGLTATLRQEDIKLIQWNGQHVKTKLHKFKGIELDLSWTQHDLDHVNQQAIRQSQKAPLISLQSKPFCLKNQDIQNKSSNTPRMYGSDIWDRKITDTSPCPRKNGGLPPQLDSQIGVLNQRWNDLRNEVKSNIQVLVEYDSLWRDYDRNVEKLLQWIEYKKLVLMRLHSGCGHLFGVRQGLAELKALETELEEMGSQFEAVHQQGDKLLGKHNHVTSLVVTESETRLYKAKNYLTSQIVQLRSHLEQVEKNWLRYDSVLEPISTKLSEAEFTISVNQNVSGTLQSYQQQLQTFRSFERSLCALHNDLAHISNITDEMCLLCGEPISEELRDNQKLLLDRWRQNVNEASYALKKMEVNERNWMHYEKLYDDRELKLRELKLSVDSIEDKLASKYTLHPSCSTTQRKLSIDKIRRYAAQLQAINFQLKTIKLQDLAADKETICDMFDSPTCLQVDAKFEYLVNEFETTSLRCSKMDSDLNSALVNHQDFEKALSEVDLILKNCEDYSKRTTGDHKRKLKLRMDFLQEALADLGSQEYVLKKANELACLIIISDAEKIALKVCNSKWTTLAKDLRTKLESTEKIWLEQKCFAEKCQYWVDFVREASSRLKEAQNFIGSYEGFKLCYKDLQDLTNEIVGKQPLMNSIMSEGRKLMLHEDETGIYSEQLKTKIEETKEEWKQTVQVLDKEKTRKTQILEKWINFNSDLSRTTQWLGSASNELDSLQSSLMLSEDSIRSHSYGNRLKHLDDQSARRINDLQKLIEQSIVLMELSDSETKAEIDQKICSIKTRWNDLNCRIKNLKNMEADVFKKDQEMEANIEILQDIIKEAHHQFETLLVQETNSKIATVRFSDTFDLTLDELKQQFDVITGLQTKFTDGCALFERLVTTFDLPKNHEMISSKKLDSSYIASEVKERFALVAKQWGPLKTQITTMAGKIEAQIGVCSQFQNLTEQIENSLVDCDKALKKLTEADDVEDLKSGLHTMKNTQIAFAKASMKMLTEDVIENLRRLICSSNKGAFKEAESRVEKLKHRLDQMDAIISKRVEKIREMLAASNELERKLEFLKRWFGHVENQLGQPIHVHSLDDEAFDHILNKHQELHQDIVNHTESVLSVIELCNMLDSESDVFPKLGLQSDSNAETASNSSKLSKTSTMDLSLLRNRCRTVGKRWDRITAQSQDRLARINRAWDNCRKFLKSCEDFKEYIESFHNEIEVLQSQASPFSPSSDEAKQLSQSTDELIQQLSERRDEFNKSLGQLQAINEQYRILYHDAGVGISTVTSGSLSKTSDGASEMGPRSGLRNKLDEINKRWSEISIEFDEIESKLKRGLKQVEEFSQVRQTLMVWLMDLDIRIDNIDTFSSNDNLRDRLVQLKDVQRDVETHQGRIDYLNMIGQRLLSTLNSNGPYLRPSTGSQGETNLQLSFVESELKDFNRVADKIKERLSRLTQKLNPLKSTFPERITRGSFEARRGKSLELESKNRGLGHLSPRSRALKHLELSAVANNNLLTSSTYDLRTSFSSGNTRGSSTGFRRKSASLCALNRDSCLTGTATTTSGSSERGPNAADYKPSGSSPSTDRRSIGSSAPRSIVSEDFSVYFRNSSDSFLQNALDGENKHDFFAHRPQISSEQNDPFAKRHKQDVVSVHQSNGSQSAHSSFAKPQNEEFLNDFEWDPYEPLPLQRSVDHLIVRAPMSNSSSSTVNFDLNHNRSSELPHCLLPVQEQPHYNTSSSRCADPMKKTFTVKQKAVLLKFQPNMKDLKEALEECKANLDGSEAFLRCPTPTGEKCEMVKLIFSGNIATCKASVDVVKSVYNKLQAQEPGIFRQSNYKNLSVSVEDCSQRWDVIKQRAMEKRRRLKHNYQLWNQFLKDVTELRHWIVQYSPTYPASDHFKDPSIELRVPEDIGLEQFKRFMASSRERSPTYHVKKLTLPLTFVEELIRSHTVFMKDLVGKKTSLISINMYWEKYHIEDESGSSKIAHSNDTDEEIDYNAEVKLLNSHFDILCNEALQTQLSLQDCFVHNQELNGGIADMILWVETVERAFEMLQMKYNSKPPESIAAEVHAALLQLKTEVDTNQETVEMIRSNAEQLLMFASQDSVLADSSSHSCSLRSKSSGLSSMSPYTEETSEVKERLYILCSRFRVLQRKLATSLELVQANTQMVRSDSTYSWRRLLSVYSSSPAATNADSDNRSSDTSNQGQNRLSLNDDNNNNHEPLTGLARQKLGLDGATSSCQSLRDPRTLSRESAPINESLIINSNTQAGAAVLSSQNIQQDLISIDTRNADPSQIIMLPLEQLQSYTVERILATIEEWPFEKFKKIGGLTFELLETSLLVPVTRDCPWLQRTDKDQIEPTTPEIEKDLQHWTTKGLLWVNSNLKFVHFLFMLFILMYICSRISFLPAVNVRTPNTLLGIKFELNHPYGPPPF